MANSDNASNNTDQKNAPTETPSTENKTTDNPILGNNKNLMIICGPNGVSYELYSQKVSLMIFKA